MTEVEFHTGVPDPLAFACRLLRKAYRQGVRVLVTATPEMLAALDRELWVFDAREFVPHLRLPGAAAAVAALTPIWLAAGATAVAGLDFAPRVLVNLGADAPPEPAALERLIEIVAVEPVEAARGRQRWRAYKVQGLAIRHYAASGPDRTVSDE